MAADGIGEAEAGRTEVGLRGHGCQVHAQGVGAGIAEIIANVDFIAGGRQEGTPAGGGRVVDIHKDGVLATGEAFPDPLAVAADAAQVVGVGQDDLGAGGCRGDIGIDVDIAAGRDPVGGAVVEVGAGVVGPGGGHAHRMLFGLGSFIALDVVDHVVLPGGVGRAACAFIADLVQDIVEIVDTVDDFADIGFLQGSDLAAGQGMGLAALVIAVEVTVDVVDVVGKLVGMTIPGIVVALLALHTPAVEEHDGDIDTLVAGFDDALAHAVEVGLVELV